MFINLLWGLIRTFDLKKIYNRCYIQHKNQAFTKTSKHKLFYNSVIKNGWDKFILNVICVTPNHVNVFSEEYPHFILTDKDYLILQDLSYYELTVAEQLNLNYYKPSLNSSLLANWSSYNLGSKGYIKNKELKDHLSLSFLNRMYTKDTKELHKTNNLGKKKLDLLTKAKCLSQLEEY